MITTAVGSYPIYPTDLEKLVAFQNGSDPFRSSIEASIEEQIEAGLDIVTTGQTRLDMVRLFTTRISGISNKGRIPHIIRPMKIVESMSLEDIKISKDTLPFGRRIKGILTGPYTLTQSTTFSSKAYKDEREVAFAFAEILNREARFIENDVEYIQIDEPYFSNLLPYFAKDLIEVVTEGIKKPIAIHVCGDTSEIFNELTEFPVDILDLEFSRNKKLLTVVSRSDFSQKIGFGCVDSKDEEVETIEKITKRIISALEIIEEDRIIIKPDCGLRHLPRENAFWKLRNMVKARNNIEGVEVPSKRLPLGKKDWDPAGFFYVVIDRRSKEIRVEHYSYDYILQKVITGTQTEEILHTVLSQGMTTDTLNGKRHYGYIASELQKAEIALKNNLPYEQDKELQIN